MGVSTLHASNIKGKTFEFAWASRRASCVDWASQTTQRKKCTFRKETEICFASELSTRAYEKRHFFFFFLDVSAVCVSQDCLVVCRDICIAGIEPSRVHSQWKLVHLYIQSAQDVLHSSESLSHSEHRLFGPCLGDVLSSTSCRDQDLRAVLTLVETALSRHRYESLSNDRFVTLQSPGFPATADPVRRGSLKSALRHAGVCAGRTWLVETEMLPTDN